MDKQEARELIKALNALDKSLSSMSKLLDIRNRQLDKLNNNFQSLIDKIGTTNQLLQNK